MKGFVDSFKGFGVPVVDFRDERFIPDDEFFGVDLSLFDLIVPISLDLLK